jgi:general secretion pathway protein H
MRVRKSQPTTNRRSAAFTLIEILVVLVIVGILMAVAFLSFGILGDDRSLDREARRLASLIELVSDEATVQGRDFGLEFLAAGYRFVEYDPLIDQWFEVIGDEYLQQRALDEGVEFELYLEDRKIQLHTEAQDIERDEDEDDDENDAANRYQAPQRDLTDDYLPHVLILSSGDITPFDLRFIRFADRSELLLSMELTGEIKIGEDDDAVR